MRGGPTGSFTCTTVWVFETANTVWVRRFDRVRARVIASAVLALALGACQGKPSSTPSGAEIRLPDQEARDFTLTESSEGRKSWTLKATYAAMYNDRNLVDARTVLIDFFDAEGEIYSTLVADEGLVHQRTNDLEARGRVKIVTTKGVTLETDSLRWINATGKIVSDAFVRVTRSGDVVTGRGFESDPNLDHFQLVSEVRAEVREPEEGTEGSGSGR
jgi:LPS export ABC transporter protein LptC